MTRGIIILAAYLAAAWGLGYSIDDAQAARKAVASQLMPTPGIVLVHGGGFTGGSTSTMEDESASFRSAGYKTLNCNYSLTNIGQAITDVHNCVKTFKDQGRKVILWGESAGGTLAEAVGVTGYADAVVAAASPTNFLNWKAPDGEWFGTDIWWANAFTVPVTLEQRRAWSPLFRIDSDSAPLLLFHSNNDTLVGLEQPTQLYQALQARGREVGFVPMGDSYHSFTGGYQAIAANWVTSRWPPSAS